MKIRTFCPILFLLICLMAPLSATAQAVAIPDANLRASIETALGKAPGDPISQGDMATLTELNASESGISDLTGLEYATNLSTLNLYNNSVSDISALASLTNLTELSLSSNSVSDISALAGLANLTELNLYNNSVSDISALASLTNLTVLGLGDNSVSDISALAGLTNLTGLSLSSNSVSDISALAGLTNLTYLTLDNNPMSDISALAGLINLEWLTLSWNSVSDISALAGLINLQWLTLEGNTITDLSPLVENTGLGDEDEVFVTGNPLSYPSIHTHIPDLQSRGVQVDFDSRGPATLHKISGELTASDNVMIVEVRDANDLPFAGVPVTFSVISGGGTLGVTDTTTDIEGRAQSQLNFGSDGETNRVEVSAAGIEERLTFEAISDAEPPQVSADVNGDQSVNILDLVFVASRLGEQGADLAADVNGDGVVNILDLVAVAGMLDNAAPAAPSVQSQALGALNAADVQTWLTEAASLAITDAIMKRGIATLERLAAFLKPTETVLLANYPNPFNPETWIAYRLAEDAVVTLTIYDANGRSVRRLDLGHRTAAVYEHQSDAIYWDGRNERGERVESGVYFYQLSAGDYSATRKMVILK